MQRDRLARRAREMGRHLETALRDLQQRHVAIGDVRGRGLLLGVELVEDRQSKRPAHALGQAVARRCLELGACLNISRRAQSSMFRIAPPLTVARDEIDRAVGILDRALEDCSPA